MSCAGSYSTDSGVRNPSTTPTLVAPGLVSGAGAVARQRYGSKLPLGRTEVPVQVRRVHFAVRAPLAHRGACAEDPLVRLGQVGERNDVVSYLSSIRHAPCGRSVRRSTGSRKENK